MDIKTEGGLTPPVTRCAKSNVANSNLIFTSPVLRLQAYSNSGYFTITLMKVKVKNVKSFLSSPPSFHKHVCCSWKTGTLASHIGVAASSI